MPALSKMPLALLAVVLALPVKADDIRAQMTAVLRYSGLDNPSPGDVAQMAGLWIRAQQPGLSNDDRRLAFREMYLFYYKLHGRDLTSRAQALDGLAQMVTATFN